MQCNKCGSILAEGATFCPNCGAPVEQNMGNATPNNLNSGVSADTNQGTTPDLMAQMFNQPSNSVQPETPNTMNNIQPDMTTQTAAESQPDLMSQMSNTNQAGVQPEMPNVVNNPQPDMTNQTVANSQPDLMSQMSNTNQTGVQPEMPTTMNNMQQNMNNQSFNYGNSQQTDPFPNAQPMQPINQMPQGQMAGQVMKKPINKKALIIGGVVAVILVAVVVCFLIFSNSGTVVNMEGVDVWVPNGYTEDSQYGYDKVYMSKEKDVMVGLITESSYGATLDQYMEVLDSGKGFGSVECGKGTKQTIKNQEWAHYSCSTSTQNSNMYITTKDNKVYMVEIAAKTDSANKIASIDKKISQNLKFAN